MSYDRGMPSIFRTIPYPSQKKDIEHGLERISIALLGSLAPPDHGQEHPRYLTVWPRVTESTSCKSWLAADNLPPGICLQMVSKATKVPTLLLLEALLSVIGGPSHRMATPWLSLGS